jgi:hypothetical protein
MRADDRQFNQTMKTIFPYLILAAIFFSFSPRRNGFTDHRQGDTIVSKFRPLKFEGSDEEIAAEILRRFNAAGKNDEAAPKYYDAKFVDLKQTYFKILVVKGEYSGATYTSFAESHLIIDDKISDAWFDGAIFRIEAVGVNTFLVYVARPAIMGSDHFEVYRMYIDNLGFTAARTSDYGNYTFDLIREKNNESDKLPNYYPEKNPDDVTRLLRLDTMRLAPNTRYWIDEESFLTHESADENDSQFTVYYRHTNGDILERILRIENRGKVTKRVLAMRADDPYERLSSAFVNDSVYREYYKEMEADEDLQELMAYEIDSTVTDYRYDRNFNFTETAKKKWHYRTEQITKKDSSVYRRIDVSEPFALNNLKVRWKTVATFPYYEGQKAAYPDVTYILIDSGGKEILQAEQPSMPYYSGGNFPGPDDFIDVNLDGNLDFKLYNPDASGSAGSFEDVYLYNPKMGKFEFSELFSGYDISVDVHNRTVSSYGKSGYFSFGVGIIRLGKKSEVLYVEEYNASDDGSQLILTYTKRKGNKIIVKKTATYPIEKFETREDVESALFSLPLKK